MHSAAAHRRIRFRYNRRALPPHQGYLPHARNTRQHGIGRKRGPAATRLVSPSLSGARRDDSRPPVLILRSFKDEPQFTEGGSVNFASLTRSSVQSLEEHLTDRLWRFGPVIAIGQPGESDAPAG